MTAIKYFNNDGSGGFDTLEVSTSADSVALTAVLPDTFAGVELDTLYLYITAISAADAVFTVNISRDSGGDEQVIPEFTVAFGVGEGDMAGTYGVTTTDTGSVVARLCTLVPRMIGVDLSTLYLTLTVSSGDATLEEAYISGRVV